MGRFGVVFDFDGVLVNSTPYSQASINDVFRAHGFGIDDLHDASSEKFRGQSLRDIVAQAKKRYGFSMDVEVLSRRAGEVGFAKMKRDGWLAPDRHLVQLLTELRQHEVPLAIASSSLRWRIDYVLKEFRIEEYFTTIVSAEDVPEHKPNPHLFLAAAEALQLPTARLVAIEDAPSGVEAAERAGMKVVGFTGFIKEPLRGVDMTVASFSELTYSKLAALLIDA